MLTTKQITWASSHDWYKDDLGDGSILCNDYNTNGLRAVLRFDNFTELRNWAGY